MTDALFGALAPLGVKNEADLIVALSYVMIASGASAFVALVWFMAAPYGRYANEAAPAFGFMMNGRLAWVLQELPSFLIPAAMWLWGVWTANPRLTAFTPNTVLLGMFLYHYFNRALIFPLRIRGGKPTPFGVFLMAFVFCLWNGYLQGRSLSLADYPPGTMWEPHFIMGIVVFFTGMAINRHADAILLNLRKPGDTRYYIPRGGMFEYVSGANFFGEIVEWTGFAIAAWSLPAAAFAIFTFCNIGPRGAQHHKNYLVKFEDYPRTRKAVIPFIW